MIRFTLRIPSKVDCQLKKIAEEQGRSKTDLIKVACWELVEKYKQRKTKGGEADGRKSSQNKGLTGKTDLG